MRNGEESGGGFRPPSGQQNAEGGTTGESNRKKFCVLG
jgi:hypothetical protein